jgi:glycosyltransferase involved in cell wall biosynthesis
MFETNQIRISVIIPTLNEEKSLSTLLPFLQAHGGEQVCEVIVCDAGSIDQTKKVSEQFGAAYLACNQKGRPFQMNEGAACAKGNVLYFLHADTIPPASFSEDILHFLNQGFEAGCYRYRFDSDRAILKHQARLTRYPFLIFRGGDQSLYITKSLFDKINGFDPHYFVMEDYDIIKRSRKHTSLWSKAVSRGAKVAASGAAGMAASKMLGKKSRANPMASGITSAAGSIATDLAGPIAGRFVRNLIGGLMR